ncbi:hypothetical protein LZ31DRAFT_617375 [Colletotrichum somersetense]|nr:hypothetical protein LZ31DRAFT_617375 [Colletotrichum somersetense]
MEPLAPERPDDVPRVFRDERRRRAGDPGTKQTGRAKALDPRRLSQAGVAKQKGGDKDGGEEEPQDEGVVLQEVLSGFVEKHEGAVWRAWRSWKAERSARVPREVVVAVRRTATLSRRVVVARLESHPLGGGDGCLGQGHENQGEKRAIECV